MDYSTTVTENGRVQKKRCLDCLNSTEAPKERVTLPSIFAPQHLENFQIFKDRANKAFAGAFPKTNEPRYTKAKVLLLSWEDDDLGVASEIRSLGAVFERALRFETEIWNIPSLGSEEALTNCVFKFRICAAPDQLLIVYYGGHADRMPHNHCIWRCNKEESSSTLDWSLIQPFLLSTSSDTLVLLDCCFAGRGGKDITPCQTTNEVIAACSPESPATGVERRSFTSAMTRELELLAHKHEKQGTRFTAVSLHSALFRYDRELRYAPFYVRLTDHECMSIDLTPLPRVPGRHYPIEMMGCVPEISQEIIRVPEPGARILLAIKTTRSPEGDLVDFLRSEGILPEYVSSMEVVKIEAVYKSHSTLTLVSLPMEVWSLLPEDAACFAIGTVFSGNLLRQDGVAPVPSNTDFTFATRRHVAKNAIPSCETSIFGGTQHHESSVTTRSKTADQSRRDRKLNPSTSTVDSPDSHPETRTLGESTTARAALEKKMIAHRKSLKAGTTGPEPETARRKSVLEMSFTPLRETTVDTRNSSPEITTLAKLSPRPDAKPSQDERSEERFRTPQSPGWTRRVSDRKRERESITTSSEQHPSDQTTRLSESMPAAVTATNKAYIVPPKRLQKAVVWQCHLCRGAYMSIRLSSACLDCEHQLQGCPYCTLASAASAR